MPFSPALPRRSAAGAVRRPPVAPTDVALAALVLAVQAVSAAVIPPTAHSDRPDLLGWTLLTGSAVVLVWRRRAPMACMLGMVAFVALYHGLGYIQSAPVLSSVVALYALAVAGPPLRTFLMVPVVVGLMVAVMSTLGKPHIVGVMLQSAGWVVVVPVAGEVVRIHRNYVAAITERAERAERTREEEAARRVAEERLRIARDLHDLLAHSITLIGVQTSVAAHVLVADPDRLDRTAVAGALDAIAETCREARSELRTTLRVLRADADGPLPSLAGIPSLTRTAEATGAQVHLTMPPQGREERREQPSPAGGPGSAPEGAAPGAPQGRGERREQPSPVGRPGEKRQGAAGAVLEGRGELRDQPPSGGGSGDDPQGAAREELREQPPSGGGSGDGPEGAEPAVPVDQNAGDIPPAVGAAAYRIIQESLTNAVRHAGTPTPRITVTLLRRGAALHLRVEDDGPHPSPPRAEGDEGFGIMGMRERARSVGGTLTAAPRRDGPGFVVTAELPLTADPPRKAAHRGPGPGPAAGPATTTDPTHSLTRQGNPA